MTQPTDAHVQAVARAIAASMITEDDTVSDALGFYSSYWGEGNMEACIAQAARSAIVALDEARKK